MINLASAVTATTLSQKTMDLLSPRLTFKDSPIRHQAGGIGIPLALGLLGGLASVLVARRVLRKEKQCRDAARSGNEEVIASRLSRIQALQEKKVISQLEYQAARERILNEI